MHLANSIYAQLRAARRAQLLDTGTPDTLHEGGPPPERWLQQVWRHQRVRRTQLHLADGAPLRVLHPGFWNREAGPDFRRAVIQFGDDPPRTGDVELDLVTAGWRGHGHATSERFAQVILHVVWDEADTDRSRPPVMAIKPFLDAPLSELAEWLDLEAPASVPDNVPGRCSGPLRELSTDTLTELLRQAAQLRRERKAVEFTARARHVGWENALWEGLLAALGYKHNAWAFRRLAELVPLAGRLPMAEAPSAPAHPMALEAHFLGLAGLLPLDLSRGADPHLRGLWDCWWRERDALNEIIVPKTLWRLAGIRPANRPERRLVLAAHWRYQPTLPTRLENWIRSTPTRRPSERALDLLQLLAPSAAETPAFWARHWTLRSMELPEAHPLLGAPRVTDLAVNVILPWLWARIGREGGPSELRQAVELCWREWPAGEDNAVLRLTRQRLFGTQQMRLPARAFVQQGLLQITRDFCDSAGALCHECRFPDFVRAPERLNPVG